MTRLSIVLSLLAAFGLTVSCYAADKSAKAGSTQPVAKVHKCKCTHCADKTAAKKAADKNGDGKSAKSCGKDAQAADTKAGEGCPKAQAAKARKDAKSCICSSKDKTDKSCPCCAEAPASQAVQAKGCCKAPQAADGKVSSGGAKVQPATANQRNVTVVLAAAETDKPSTDGKPAAATTPPAASKPASQVEMLPSEKGKPFAVVQRAKKGPQLDGKIDEGWGEPTLSGFFSEDTRKSVKPNVQTQVWLHYDDQNLYVVARLLEPNMDELQANTTERDGEVWHDDAFEIFLDPNNKADPSEYVQLAVNPINTISDQRGAPDVSGDAAWDCKGCKVKTGKGKDFWVVEMAIPLESLGVKGPVAGKHWGANFARERKPGAAENSSWVNMGPDWHQPDQFGHIAFEP